MEWSAGLMRLFAVKPWEYPQGEAWILDEWETDYLKLVWRKLRIGERRLLKTFAWNACKQVALIVG